MTLPRGQGRPTRYGRSTVTPGETGSLVPRVDDSPFPTIGGHRPYPEPWPARLRIGVERGDNPSTRMTTRWRPMTRRVTSTCMTRWNGPENGWTCSAGSRDGPESGSPDDEGVYDAGARRNDGGQPRRRTVPVRRIRPPGQLQPGAALDVWAETDGEGWWLFPAGSPRGVNVQMAPWKSRRSTRSRSSIRIRRYVECRAATVRRRRRESRRSWRRSATPVRFVWTPATSHCTRSIRRPHRSRNTGRRQLGRRSVRRGRGRNHRLSGP